MLLEPTLGYKSVWRVLDLMGETPGRKMARQELRHFTHLGNKSLTNALRRLTLSGILLKDARKELYWLNLPHPYAALIHELIARANADLGHMDFASKIAILDFARKMMEEASFVQRLILFGSVARGTAAPASDIDIAVVTKRKLELKEKLQVQKIAGEIEKKHGKSIQEHYFTREQFRGPAKNKLILQVRREGKDLLALPRELEIPKR